MDRPESARTARSAYEHLEKRFHGISVLHSVIQVLGWDTAAMMPAGGLATRVSQSKMLESLYHQLIADPAMSDLFEGAQGERANLTKWQAANLREMHREWRRATAVPVALAASFQEVAAHCEMTWREARAHDDFATFAPAFDALLDITRELGEALAASLGGTAYDALLQRWEPDFTAREIDLLFDDLAAFLPALLDESLASQAARPPRALPTGPFPLDRQRGLCLELMRALGFDFQRGRLDTSLGPFCAEDVPDDVRITTRYDEDRFTVALLPLLHETAHARYEQGLPKAWQFQPVGRYRSASFQEGQALLAEMHIARSEPFLRFLLPLLRKHFPDVDASMSADDFCAAMRAVRPEPIRAGSDEVTYPLHIILRYRLERALLARDLQVKDLPGAWNDLSHQLLRVRPANNRLGCMQDIHWPKGLFAYFPTYALGAMTAAQLFAAAVKVSPHIVTDMEGGTFAGLYAWMQENVFCHGRLFETRELLVRASGSPLGTQAYKTHLRARYLPPT